MEPATSEAMNRWAVINGMVHRLTGDRPAARQRAWTLEDLKA
jgi:hypothetical protein